MESSGQVKMTSGGRGRGWGSTSGGALRRPGDSPTVSAQNNNTDLVQPEIEAFLAAVHAIPVHDTAATSHSLKFISNLIRDHFTTTDSLRAIVEKMHIRSLEDRIFAQKTAIVCGDIHILKMDGIKIQKLILDVLQKDYEEHGRIQTSSPKFLNTVFFLNEIFTSMRIEGFPIRVLAEPLLKYLMFLLNGDEHDMELFTSCLSQNGKELAEIQPIMMNDIMKHVRTVLMSRNISGQGRCWLLLALDMSTRNFGLLPPDLYTFYRMHLSSVVLDTLKLDPSLAVEVPDSPASPPLQDKVAQPIPVTPPRETVTSPREPPSPTTTPQSAIQRRPSSGGGDGRSVANRPSIGSGRLARNWRSEAQGNVSARGDANTRGDVNARGDWKDTGSKSKNWGHDDRFDKADDYYGRPDRRDLGSNRNYGGHWQGGDGDTQRNPKFTNPFQPIPLAQRESWD